MAARWESEFFEKSFLHFICSPACMIVVGAHYLPFIFQYGMPQFGALAGILVSAGLLIGLYVPSSCSQGSWLTAVTLLAFAFLGRRTALKEKTDLAGGAVATATR